jgi:hypothetical protein
MSHVLIGSGIVSLLFVGLCAYLAYRLYDERTAHAQTRAGRELLASQLDHERQQHRLTARFLKMSAHTIKHQIDRIEQARAERDDAHKVLEFVLDHKDVAPTLDMVKVVPLHPTSVHRALDTASKRIPGEAR